MNVILRIAGGILLISHGLVHLLYLVSDAEDPDSPFTLTRSWLFPEAARRPVAVVLIAITILAFVLLALAVWRVPGLSTAWPALAIVASLASLVTVIAFWSIQFVAGAAIDVAVLLIALVRPRWTERIG